MFTQNSKKKSHFFKYPDQYPLHILKRTDKPTTIVNEHEIQRFDERETGFARAHRGDFNEMVKREYKRFVSKHPLSASLDAMSCVMADYVDEKKDSIDFASSVAMASSYSFFSATAPKTAPHTSNPEKMARHIKAVSYFLRSDVVGICKLPPYAVYSKQKPDGKTIELNHTHAIAILIDQDSVTSRGSNGHDWISNSQSFISYSTTGFISCILADYIRRLGYSARAHHAMNYQVAITPILLWAGLGEMCRIGDIVLNPFLGPRFKAAVVTTDLPLTVDKPIDFGLQDFCKHCKKCARECPSGAISLGNKVMYNGYEKWPVDVKKCTSFRISNQNGAGCGTCIKVCPWNKPYTPFHRMINWTMRNVPIARKFGIYGDDLMGYGKAKIKNKWWLDLESEVTSGNLIVPPKR